LMDSDYGQRYRELYDRHWWWRAREAVVLGELARLRPPGGWKRALDVGCGDGLLFARLGDYAAHVEGLEPDRALVSEARAAGGRIHLRPFDPSFRPEHRYDLILFLDVLEHIEDAQGAVAHAATLLEPGGVVLVTVPAFRHLWTTHDDLNRHVTRYTRGELVALLATALTVEKARYFFRWVHPAKVVQRAMEAARRPTPASPTIPPEPLNRMMYALSRMEEAVLGWSTIPVGSSLLAVARSR
jgi:2-polyprenyl-3-methyl-5-hydroxy-6-metoxy-1,4-benzoquinol methylase